MTLFDLLLTKSLFQQKKTTRWKMLETLIDSSNFQSMDIAVMKIYGKNQLNQKKLISF